MIWGSALKKSVSCSQCDFGFCFGRLWKTVNVGLFSDAPAPQQLVLERQLTNSVLISWRVPHGLDPGSIQAYHVYLNGVLKATLKGSERTKALLEGVDANQVSGRFCR